MLLVPKESFQHHRAHGDDLIMKEFGISVAVKSLQDICDVV